MMPSNVKIFWWLSVAVVTYSVLATVWHIAFPGARYFAMLAKFSPELRESARRADILIPTMATSFWAAVTLGFAWLAAFRKRNQARWAYAFAFVFREILLPCIALAYVYLVPIYDALYRQLFWDGLWKSTVSEWSNPRSCFVPALTIIAIAAVFTGNARDWFRAPR